MRDNDSEAYEMNKPGPGSLNQMTEYRRYLASKEPKPDQLSILAFFEAWKKLREENNGSQKS